MRRSKRLGQNFLVDERIIEKEVAHARVEGKSVLEIGAGTGNLTEKLAEKAGKLVAVEKDGKLIPELRERLKQFKNVEIIHADFLEMSGEELKGFDVVVSNVPYSISSPLLFKLLDVEFERAVLCLQKEFVDRMLAQPGERNRARLSVTTQVQFKVEKLERVSRNSFNPVPKVDSAVIMLERKKARLGEFDKKIVLALFQHKKKKVANALVDSAGVLGVERGELKARLKECSETGALQEERVFNLSNEQILMLSEKIRKHIEKNGEAKE
ncbi:ribosomal RNA small subunit methyltransferase A [Candidatus Micrarchaeota archaeon]|nr:ribosomal RNA small subunit methyltransferase A [Candidatus Micrarchaeota archaeon]